jgi:hypothetical protein
MSSGRAATTDFPVQYHLRSAVVARCRIDASGKRRALLALAVAFASDWAVLLIAPWAVAMHVGVVLREEQYLEAKFGDDYRRYKDRVPRYGRPF